MEEFDQLVSSIIAQLDAIHHVAHSETEESHAILHDLKLEVTTAVLVFLAIALRSPSRHYLVEPPALPAAARPVPGHAAVQRGATRAPDHPEYASGTAGAGRSFM